MWVRGYKQQAVHLTLCSDTRVRVSTTGLAPRNATGPGGNCTSCAKRLITRDELARDYWVQAITLACEARIEDIMVDSLPPGNWTDGVPERACLSDCDTDHVFGGEVVVNPVTYMVSLAVVGADGSLEHACGGTLIRPNTVLSAAHCVAYFEAQLSSGQARSVRATVAALKLSDAPALAGDPNTGVDILSVVRMLAHPGYDTETKANDVALLWLERSVSDRPMVPGPWLAEPVAVGMPVNAMVAVIGYGMTESGQVSDFLRQVTMPVVNTWTCNASYGGQLNSDEVCAGKPYQKDACGGDSGGPLLLVEQDGTWLGAQVGVVSKGTGCPGDRGGVYASVAYHAKWVVMNVDSNNGRSIGDGSATTAVLPSPGAATIALLVALISLGGRLRQAEI